MSKRIRRGRHGLGWSVDGIRYTEYQVSEWRSWGDVSFSKDIMMAAKQALGEKPVGLTEWLNQACAF